MEYGLALKYGIQVVNFLVEGFIQKVNENRNLIGEALNQAEELQLDLMFLKNVNEDAVMQPQSNNVITKALIRELRDIIYRAEDAIDLFVVKATANDSNWYSRLIPNSKFVEISQRLTSLCEKVKAIREKVEGHITAGCVNQTEEDGKYEGPPKEQLYAPIFNKEENVLRELITREANECESIFITGAHGSGKTTLAAKMFHDSNIREQFNKCIWVSVCNSTARNIFLAVLSSLNKLYGHEYPDPIFSINMSELSELVASCLVGNSFLIVLDNVSEAADWHWLAHGFVGSGQKSKVLMTCNNNETAWFRGRQNRSIMLNPLGEDDSWSLLELRVFSSNNECPSQLVSYGKHISKQCNGLPQAITFVGDTLARRNSPLNDMNQTQKLWCDVSVGMTTFFEGGTYAHDSNILSSYNKLRYELRACFLYLGIFPQGSKFSVSQLTRMWISEGFVQPHTEVLLEKVAEGYLTELINWNLVIVEEKRPDGSAKTCSMNVLPYVFCTKEAGYEGENFFQEFRKSRTDGDFVPTMAVANRNRRVCIHNHISKFIPKFFSSKHHGLNIHLHSFVSRSKEVFTLPSRDTSNFHAAFRLLRVLDAKPIKFKNIPSNLCKLIHLRYVTLSLDGAILPASISKLKNMRTLVVHTTSNTLKIEADIMKMTELRHLKTNASATLSEIGNASEGGERLQQLSEISPKSCTLKLFNKTPNLKKLGIRGELALLLSDRNKSLLGKLEEVENLKLINDVKSSNHADGLDLLLQPWEFHYPPNIRSLTLSKTSLKWEHISSLESLRNLEELKLKNDAFVGENWVVTGEGFSELQTLHIECLPFKEWKLSEAHFPKLRRLLLSECKELVQVPIELANIRSFYQLHMRGGNIYAAQCAEQIRQTKLEMKQNDSRICFQFHRT